MPANGFIKRGPVPTTSIHEPGHLDVSGKACAARQVKAWVGLALDSCSGRITSMGVSQTVILFVPNAFGRQRQLRCAAVVSIPFRPPAADKTHPSSARRMSFRGI
jgi:hypothetical protein